MRLAVQEPRRLPCVDGAGVAEVVDGAGGDRVAGGGAGLALVEAGIVAALLAGVAGSFAGAPGLPGIGRSSRGSAKPSAVTFQVTCAPIRASFNMLRINSSSCPSIVTPAAAAQALNFDAPPRLKVSS